MTNVSFLLVRLLEEVFPPSPIAFRPSATTWRDELDGRAFFVGRSWLEAASNTSGVRNHSDLLNFLDSDEKVKILPALLTVSLLDPPPDVEFYSYVSYFEREALAKLMTPPQIAAAAACLIMILATNDFTVGRDASYLRKSVWRLVSTLTPQGG